LQRYKSPDFESNFITLLKEDLRLLKEIKSLWKNVDKDPKLEAFIQSLIADDILRDKKIIIFTESKETGDYLFANLERNFPGQSLFFSSHGGLIGAEKKSNADARKAIKENFDPNSINKKDDFNILITTDILAEGINLHRSNIIINYDLPWNPTRVLQRVGRVNRVGTSHKFIYIYNFFPTDESESEINLETNIKNKIQAFHDTLGEDSRYLTDEEVVSTHELFGSELYKKLNAKETYDDEVEEDVTSEFDYLKILRDLRDDDKEMFSKIRRLPKKSRSAVKKSGPNSLITFFRKGKLKKFVLSNSKDKKELSFLEAAELFKSDEKERTVPIDKKYYNLLKDNKDHFDSLVTGELVESTSKKGRSNETTVIAKLKACKSSPDITNSEEEYIKAVLNKYKLGEIPKNITKKIKKALEKEIDPKKTVMALKKEIPEILLAETKKNFNIGHGAKEVILSEYFVGDES